MRSNFSKLSNEAKRRDWSFDRRCELTGQQLELDANCLNYVKAQYITGESVFWFSSYRTDINKVIRDHNRYCSNYKLPIYEIDIIGS